MEVQKFCGGGDECNCQRVIPGLVPVEPKQQTLPGFPLPPIAKRYRAAGKEVLRDGVHYGDMIDENAASRVADAMNAADEQENWAYIVAQVK